MSLFSSSSVWLCGLLRLSTYPSEVFA
uniref:Uncharacterized protein n=1 Tax=Anguilla anguilla TaxID=7936 RepID=A0A0E9RQ36_ANGAN